MSGPLDCDCQFTLMPHAVSGNPARDNASALRQKISEKSGILEIDRRLLNTKPARPSALKQPASASATFAVIPFHHCLLVLRD
jgi:hypothetical protein